MANTINTTNSSMFDLYKIGSARSYASNLVKSYLSENGGASNISASSLSGFLNSFRSTKDSTVKNTMQFVSQNTSNLSLLKSAAGNLSAAAKTVGRGTLQSSDNSVVTAQASYYSNIDPKFDVSVKNIASAQQSRSASFESSGVSAFDTGQNSLVLQTEQGSYDVGFSVYEGDTNEDTLNSIADSINSSGADVTASVVTKDGGSTLQVTSDQTGDLSAFSFSDSGGKSAAERLEMRETTQARDANYSINGQSFSSASNTVSVPDSRGASMTLQGAGNAQLARAVDASGVVSAAQMFASAYNQTVSHLTSGSADGAGVTRALGLVANNRMTAGSVGQYGGYAASRLSAMGIAIDKDGMMQVDEEKLTAAVEQNPDAVKNALSGYGGLAETTRTNADQAMRIPSATYTDFGNMQVHSSLIDALMPQSGFLFDLGL